MDVLDGKELVLPLNLSEEDAAVFSTPVPVAQLQISGSKRVEMPDGTSFYVPCRADVIGFSNKRYIVVGAS